MDEDNVLLPSLLWERYQGVENRFIEYCEYVPLREEHFNVWSVKLASLIIEICSMLDSFLGASRDCQLFLCESEFSNSSLSEFRGALENSNPKIGCYKKVYNSFYDMGRKEILVKPLRQSICPFEDWNNDSTLWWWTNYNKVKHHRFTELERSNLKTVLYALGGLFLAIVIHVPNKKYLYDIDIIKYKGLTSPLSSHWCLDMLLRKEPAILRSKASIMAADSLFSYEYQTYSPRLPQPQRLTGGTIRWPTDELWPHCKQECIGAFYRECYRSHLPRV